MGVRHTCLASIVMRSSRCEPMDVSPNLDDHSAEFLTS